MAQSNKDMRKLIQRLQSPEFGCTVTVTGSGHWKVTRPGCGMVIIAVSGSDVRDMRNTKANLRRHLGIHV